MRVAEKEKIDLVVSDMNLEADQSGLDLLRDLRSRCPVILVTGFGTLDSAVEAAREGAWDFISKPFKVEEVVAIARRALEQAERSTAEDRKAEQLSAPYEQGGLLGRTPEMIQLYKEIARVAPTRSTVLITGQSGTGKELMARSIHQHSTRSAGPFVAINCGALTETLLEAELFGHVRGAFTGATGDHKGLWEEAEGGTFSWMRWVRQVRRCRSSCCAPYKKEKFGGSVQLARYVSMAVSSQLPIATWNMK